MLGHQITQVFRQTTALDILIRIFVCVESEKVASITYKFLTTLFMQFFSYSFLARPAYTVFLEQFCCKISIPFLAKSEYNEDLAIVIKKIKFDASLDAL